MGIRCQFRFSTFVFSELEKQYAVEPQRNRQVMLMCDEMTVKEAISFDKSTLRFQGFIDYAEFSADAKPRKSDKNEADHCLVFAIRFLNSNVVW